MRADGARCADQDEGGNGPDADLPPFVPRGICGSCAMNINGREWPGLYHRDRARARRSAARWSRRTAAGIWYSANADGGSSFHFTLPAQIE